MYLEYSTVNWATDSIQFFTFWCRIWSKLQVRYLSFWYFFLLNKWLFLSPYCTSFDFRYDSLTIYDGDSNTSPMLGNPYCGDSMPPSRISSSNHLFFHFHSDSDITGAGFKLEYNATGKNPYNSGSWSLDSSLLGCGVLSWYSYAIEDWTGQLNRDITLMKGFFDPYVLWPFD